MRRDPLPSRQLSSLWLASALGLVACATEPRLLPPDSPEGVACVAACDSVRDRCVSREVLRAQGEARSCDTGHQVEACVERAVDDSSVRACEAQRNLGHCPGSMANTAPCGEARLICALECGAKMIDP